MQILCGHDEVFDELGHLFETWYQKMVTQLTFTQPALNAASLSDEAENFLAKFQSIHENVLSSLDIALLAILRRDTRKVSAYAVGHLLCCVTL